MNFLSGSHFFFSCFREIAWNTCGLRRETYSDPDNFSYHLHVSAVLSSSQNKSTQAGEMAMGKACGILFGKKV